MNESEQSRILRMVAEGTISPEEAADLLDAMRPGASAGNEDDVAPDRPDFPMPPTPPTPPTPPFGRRGRPRVLVIHIRAEGESKVNLRIPIGLTMAARKFIPRQAQSYLSKYDINLNEFVEQMSEADSGTLLEIKDGENKVLIAVE